MRDWKYLINQIFKKFISSFNYIKKLQKNNSFCKEIKIRDSYLVTIQYAE